MCKDVCVSHTVRSILSDDKLRICGTTLEHRGPEAREFEVISFECAIGAGKRPQNAKKLGIL